MTTARILSSILPSSSFSNSSEMADKKNQIRANLKKINLSQESTDKIFELVGERPFVLNTLELFTQPTHSSRQLEGYYENSNFISEFNCTLSNIGFFAVALYYQSYATFCVGAFSALSHAIPFESLNLLDRIAAGYLFCSVIYDYPALINNPEIMLTGLATFTFGALGKMYSGSNPQILSSIFHSAWHLSAAYGLHQFYQTMSANESVPSLGFRA